MDLLITNQTAWDLTRNILDLLNRNQRVEGL